MGAPESAEFNLASIDAIFCDADGTMVAHGERLPPDDLIEAIGRVSSKVHFIPVTGRSLQDGQQFLNALPVNNAIAAGGAIRLSRVPDELGYAETQRGLLIPSHITPTLTSVSALRYWLEESGLPIADFDIEELNETGRPGESESLFMRSVSVEQAATWVNQINILLGAELCAVPAISQNGTTYDVQINRSVASKVHAITHLCIDHQLVNVGRSIYIADGLNDLDAMKACGYGVAMGNAHPQLKAVADEVIGTQEENGLVDYLATLS